MGHTMEIMYEIWNDKGGTCIEVGRDRDGLNLVEIRAKDDTQKITTRVTLGREEALLVAKAIVKLVDDIDRCKPEIKDKFNFRV